MKKRIAVLLLMSSFLVVKNVSARTFAEMHDYEQSFAIFTPKNNVTITKSLVKVTDEENTPYYDVNPPITIFENWDFYEETDANFSLEQLQQISKITYFGYGYQNKRTDAYYFATQYLVFQTFKDKSITYQLKEENKNAFASSLAEMKENIENITFSLKDFVTKNTTYEITDTYIVDNFIVQGEHINVTYEDKKIIVQFLDHQKEYVLDFQPKNKCTNNKVWKAGGVQLFKRSEVCEQNYQVKVTYQNEEKPSPSISQNNAKKENLNKKTQKAKKKSTEVKVPSTGKNDFPYSILLCLIGAILYVLKK